MATKNDITGDLISSKVSNEAFRKGMDIAFCKHPEHKFPLFMKVDKPFTVKCSGCGYERTYYPN